LIYLGDFIILAINQCVKQIVLIKSISFFDRLIIV